MIPSSDDKIANSAAVPNRAAKARQNGDLKTPRGRKAKALRLIAAANASGLTDTQLADALGYDTPSSIWWMRIQLENDGWIVDDSPGSPSIWKISEAGAKQLGLPRGWRARKKAPATAKMQVMPPSANEPAPPPAKPAKFQCPLTSSSQTAAALPTSSSWSLPTPRLWPPTSRSDLGRRVSKAEPVAPPLIWLALLKCAGM